MLSRVVVLAELAVDERPCCRETAVRAASDARLDFARSMPA